MSGIQKPSNAISQWIQQEAVSLNWDKNSNETTMAAETTFRESKVSTSTNVQTLNMIFQVTAVHTIAIGIELQLCF